MILYSAYFQMSYGVRGVWRIQNRKWPLSVDLITTISQLFLCLCLRGSLIGRRGKKYVKSSLRPNILSARKQNKVCKKGPFTAPCLQAPALTPFYLPMFKQYLKINIKLNVYNKLFLCYYVSMTLGV